MKQEQQFINFVKIGEFSKAEVLLNEIIDEALKQVMSISGVKCLMANLMSAMLRVMDEPSIVCQEEFLTSLNYVDTLLNCETLPEIQNEILSLLMKISGKLFRHHLKRMKKQEF